MAASNQHIMDACMDHKEVLARLKILEDDVKDLYSLLKDKVDSKVLEDVVERRAKEIEELKEAIIRLNVADSKHSEALAGIYQILKGFKETQDLLRQDIKHLSDCYTQTSIHIASITTILKERAKTVEDTVKTEVAKTEDKKESASMWGTIKAIFTSKPVQIGLVIVLISLSVVMVIEHDKVFALIEALAK